MNHWLLMFRPDTYEKVKQHGLIGVTSNHAKRILDIREGDRFVAYVSRKQLIDGYGVFTSTAFADTTPVFGVSEIYPYRARVRFERSGAEKDARVLLWGLAEFANGEPKTSPANMLLCRGGFMRITPEDYETLCAAIVADAQCCRWSGSASIR
jgi:hypothetical protein